MPPPHPTTPMTPSKWTGTSSIKSSPYKHAMMPPCLRTQHNTSPHPLLHLSKRSTHLLSTSELTNQLRVAHICCSHLHSDWRPLSAGALPSPNNTSQQPKDVPTNWPASLSNMMPKYADFKCMQAMSTCSMTINITTDELTPKSPLKIDKTSRHNGFASWGMGKFLLE